ncbi:hypothetical protein NKI31_13390 [Mesorhizobium sp. M0659]|uniref:hypothetical protein n=1 Tax=Mesorhizobium sp. M0659 TaxID=2956980 RepID=UPI00333B7CC9
MGLQHADEGSHVGFIEFVPDLRPFRVNENVPERDNLGHALGIARLAACRLCGRLYHDVHIGGCCSSCVSSKSDVMVIVPYR